MGVKIRTIPEIIGVKCPKKMGAMDKSESCKMCPYWEKCMAGIMGILEADGQ